MTTRLCADCKEMLAHWSELPVEGQLIESKLNVQYGFRKRSYNSNTFALERASTEGCHMCRIYILGYSAEELSYLRDQAAAGKAMHEFRFRSTFLAHHIHHLHGVPGRLPKSERLVNAKHTIRLRLSNPGPNPRGHVDMHKLESSTGSITSISLAGEWFRECIDGHIACKQEKIQSTNDITGRESDGPYEVAQKYLPTRLVDIGMSGYGKSDLEPRIFLTRSIQIPLDTEYTTLSHCWGELDIFKLKRQNFEALQDAIPFVQLPKTFQDAITITGMLGFRYLWIDSLCIIQDDDDDWQQEAAQMSKVYANSTLNIAATGASDGREGCFRERDVRDVLRCQVDANLPTRTTTGKRLTRQKFDCYSLLKDQISIDRHEVDGAPLNRRAWALQERFLAPRTLHFASTQLFWQCRQIRACEMWPHSEIKDLDSRNSAHLAKTDFLVFWDSIVVAYTRAVLSKADDKLPAIAGVAEWAYSQSRGKNTYLAGLWRANLEHQLIWHLFKPGQRPNHYRAPSWSWASVDGATVDISKFLSESTRSDKNLLIHILDASISLSGPSPFGRVCNGSIRLRCHRLLLMTTSSGGFQLDGYKARHNNKLHLHLDATLNESIKEIYWMTILERWRIVPKDLRTSYHQGVISGLALLPVPLQRGKYSRVGYISLNVLSIDGRRSFEFLEKLPTCSATYEQKVWMTTASKKQYVITIV